jgi:hypothetical protein
MFTLKFNIDDAPKGIARRFDSRYDVVIRTLDDGTRTELHPMLQTPSGEYVRFEDYAKLVEKCERLTEAGDGIVDAMNVCCSRRYTEEDEAIERWNAAKKGGQL